MAKATTEQLLQKLADRLDAIEKRIDTLKKGQSIIIKSANKLNERVEALENGYVKKE